MWLWLFQVYEATNRSSCGVHASRRLVDRKVGEGAWGEIRSASFHITCSTSVGSKWSPLCEAIFGLRKLLNKALWLNQEDEAVKNKTLCIEETAEKFNLNRRVLEDWLKIASRQFCCEFCSKGFAVRWRLTEHQKRLHFTKEEWAMSVEGRHQRQNVEKVKLDVMPSLEEMLTKKYINTLWRK